MQGLKRPIAPFPGKVGGVQLPLRSDKWGDRSSHPESHQNAGRYHQLSQQQKQRYSRPGARLGAAHSQAIRAEALAWKHLHEDFEGRAREQGREPGRRKARAEGDREG